MVVLEGFLWGIESGQSKVLKDTHPVVNMVTYEEEVEKLGGSQ